jgi:hypothetical protein
MAHRGADFHWGGALFVEATLKKRFGSSMPESFDPGAQAMRPFMAEYSNKSRQSI